MTRPDLAPAAACLATVLSSVLVALGVLGSPAAASLAPARAGADGDEAPLRVSMSSLNPSVIPRRGALIVTGKVTNTSESTFTDLQVYLLTSREPIGTKADLAAAAASEPTAEVGDRLATEGLFTEIGDLGPGESAQYAVSVDRTDLEITDEPGVYWIGVHVLGAEEGIREPVADGRARSFIPLMERGTQPVQVALTVPLREQVRRGTDTRLLDAARWGRLLRRDGRLERLVSLVSASTEPITWVVDPAVLEAASSLAAQNPPLDTRDDGSGPPPGPGEPSPSPAPSPSPGAESSAGAPSGTGSADPSARSSTDEANQANQADAGDDASDGASGESEGGGGSDEASAGRARDAAAWLQSFRNLAERSAVMALPYGDLDVAAVASNRFTGLQRLATRLSASATGALGVDSDPIVAPGSGYLPGRAISRLDNDAPVLVSDQALPDAEGPFLTRQNGVDIALVDSSASSGGPGPNPRTDPLALRQRILAEVALHALSEDSAQPLIISVPEGWDPGPDWRQADFFGGLAVGWLQQVDLPTALVRGTGPVDTSLPVYPLDERRSHIPLANQVASKELIKTGSTYAELLTRNDSVSDSLSETALLASSVDARSRPGPAVTLARSTANRVRLVMSRVVLDGPAFVLLSSDRGPIDVTIANNLERTVTVRLEAVTGSADLAIDAPRAVTLGPGQRRPVGLRADSSSTGVRSVTLRAVTQDGTPIGTEVRLSVRTSNVGLVLWLVMGAGGVIFLLAVAARIRRQLRARQATEGPSPEPAS